ncbi:MAG: AMP-binding protein [Sutterella sp.]|nr:AMP-binding protein [Sutterella sp.]
MTENFPWFASYPSDVPHEINPDCFDSIPAVLDSVANEFPDRVAYSNMGVGLTYRRTVELSKDFAAYLQGLEGLKPGDRVAIMMPNLLQYVVAVFACLRAGFIVVNINPLYTSREVRSTLTDSGAKAIVIIENFAKTLQNAVGGTECRHIVVTGVGDLFPFVKRTLVNFVVRKVKKMVPAYSLPGAISFNDALARGRARGMTPHAIRNTDTAFLQYTGGTTGVSKGAILTHRNLIANMQQVGGWISSTFKRGEEVAMTALPLYHIFSLTATMVFTSFGATMVLITNPRDIEGLAKECIKWDFSIIIGVNTLFAAMLNNKTFCSHKFTRLKMTAGGGSQVQRTVAEKWKAQTGSNILEAYGLTECSPGVCGNIPNAPWDGSVGVPIPSTEVTIRGEGFRDLGVCPDGAQIEDYTGEICVRGPQVMSGYWKKPEETAAILRDGWLRTGDVGHMDARGVITITDRKKDMILVSGFNVYPNEVENVIASMPGVLEVGVVGVPSAKSGETVKAVIVKKDPTLTADDVKKYCRTQLTGYKMPREIIFVDALPKTAVGKILRRELKDIK